MADTTRLKCPFCNGAIPEQLAVYGGPCPHCILEIPGEEAPTDPGLAKRQAAQAEAKAAAERAGRMRGVALASLGALLLTGVVVSMALMRDDQGRLHLEFYKVMPVLKKPESTPEATAPKAKPAEPPKPRPAATPTTPDPAPASGAGLLAGRVIATGNATTAGGAITFGNVATANGTATVVPGAQATGAVGFTGGTVSGGTITGGTASASAGGAPAVSAAAGGSAAKTTADPRAVVTQRYASYKTQFRVCGDQQLAANPSFEGSWALSFTVQPDGTTANVAVRGKPNPTLQLCIETKVKGWKFATLAAPLAYSDTVSFSRAY